MDASSPKGRRSLEFVVIAVLLVVLMGVAFILDPAARVQSTDPPDSQAGPFTGGAPVTIIHERCGTAVPEFGSVCFSSTFSAGIPQNFSMTDKSNEQNDTAVTVFTDYFVVSATSENLISYSMTSTNDTVFLGFFDSGANASSLSAPDVVDSGQPFANMTGNYQSYSGNVTAPQSGAYVFCFAVTGPEFNDSVSFLLMDSAAYSNGITIKAGAPQDQQVIVTDYSSQGIQGQTGFGWQEVPITVYSQTTTSVSLTSLSLDGGWLKIVPSYLPDVGPGGANATLYLVGPQETSNPYGNYLYIGASGAGGLTGDLALKVEGGSGGSVVNGTGPINLSGDGGVPDINGLIYDPGSGAPSSLPVTFSIAGLLQNGTVVPLPSWMKVDFPQQTVIFGNGTTVATTETLGPGEYFSWVPIYENDTVMDNSGSSSFHILLEPYNPYYFVLNVDTSAATPAEYGAYTVVLNETVGAQHFTAHVTVYAEPLILPGGQLVSVSETS